MRWGDGNDDESNNDNDDDSEIAHDDKNIHL